ncbi:Holliday junction branch migration protein RuvA [Paraferrimonas sedimenticola]|uniref:Holliday junction branch migration complex subunit RuvA n=1 Tax=Paraferrimonas sedimenticola TaxID=375674 RepID=A0AA37VVJ4_9GAMM|nr:Holliday junction branch migration protein RuvA [Paraferrimonas sedimenticola]GLP96159.1 Holliday junction ATP-dependent DNA helicase RuvA [Paraferrimonas sedimenticola]
MIGRLCGVLADKQAPDVLIDVGGVGYEVQLPMTSFYELPELGDKVTVFTHFVVREDAQLLYGFANTAERALFRELIKVNGVGPKLGLAILSGMNASEFAQIVERDDASALTKLPGVGKKTAERLVIEMRDRLKNLNHVDMPLGLASTVNGNPVADKDVEGDAIAALLALGYKPQQASKAVNAVMADGLSSEELIKRALQSML